MAKCLIILLICQTEVNKGTNAEITIDIDDVNLPGMMYMWNNMGNSFGNKNTDLFDESDEEVNENSD